MAPGAITVAGGDRYAPGHHNNAVSRGPAPYNKPLSHRVHCTLASVFPSFRRRSFFSLFISLGFLPGAQPGAFFLDQPYIGRQTPLRDPDPAINGYRILVSKRVPHREEACLQRHLLRLTFLLLRIWLVHAGAWRGF